MREGSVEGGSEGEKVWETQKMEERKSGEREGRDVE